MTIRMPPGRISSEIKGGELWGLRLIKIEVCEYGVAWLSVEYTGEVGSVYLCGLNTCMGEDDEAWLIWPGVISVSNKSSLKEGVEIKFS